MENKRKWWLVGLLALLVGLGLAAFGGWAHLQAIKLPFLFEVARYQLAPNWYLAEFQPIFLKQFSQDGTAYLLVAYRNSQGKWVTGKVVVGGQYQNQALTWLPYTLPNDANPANEAKDNFRYPFYPGQRVNLKFMIAKEKAGIEELAKICERAPRVCQIAQMTLNKGATTELVAPNGLEPAMPVMAVGISSKLESPIRVQGEKL